MELTPVEQENAMSQGTSAAPEAHVRSHQALGPGGELGEAAAGSMLLSASQPSESRAWGEEDPSRLEPESEETKSTAGLYISELIAGRDRRPASVRPTTSLRALANAAPHSCIVNTSWGHSCYSERRARQVGEE